jgi:hypothetical protein
MPRSPWKPRVFAGLLACQAAALSAASAFGGISVLTDSRTVAISGQADQINLNPPPAQFVGPAYNHSAAAAPLAPFNQSFSDSSDANGKTLSSASASQTSNFQVSADQLAFTASGSVKYMSLRPETLTSAQSSYGFTFSVDAPTTYSLSEVFGPNPGPPQNDNSIANTGASLIPGVGPGVSATDSLIPSGRALTNSPASVTGTANFTGILPAGQYTFGGIASGNSSEDGGLATYDVHFTLTQSGSSTMPPVPAVPLPAAVWMGLGTMGLLTAGLACRRRFA